MTNNVLQSHLSQTSSERRPDIRSAALARTGPVQDGPTDRNVLSGSEQALRTAIYIVVNACIMPLATQKVQLISEVTIF